MNMDLITSAAIGGIGWIGLLAKNYFTQMANLRIKEAEQAAQNEQRRIEKQESYYERLFGLFMQTVGEEKDERLAFQHEMTRIGSQLLENQVKSTNHLNALVARIENSCATTKGDR